MDTICMLFLLCSQLRLSSVSVVFDLNTSLSDVVPLSPMLLPADLIIMKKSELLVDAICVSFILSSPLILSSVSVVFDFNASLNDFIPDSPMLLPVDLMRIESYSQIDIVFVCCIFLCVHDSDRAQ